MTKFDDKDLEALMNQAGISDVAKKKLRAANKEPGSPSRKAARGHGNTQQPRGPLKI